MQIAVLINTRQVFVIAASGYVFFKTLFDGIFYAFVIILFFKSSGIKIIGKFVTILP